MKHVQTFESFMDKDNILKEASTKIDNLTIKSTKKGVEIIRTDYNGGLPAEQITIFKNEIAELIDFLQKL